jgi:hypothetical protein
LSGPPNSPPDRASPERGRREKASTGATSRPSEGEKPPGVRTPDDFEPEDWSESTRELEPQSATPITPEGREGTAGEDEYVLRELDRLEEELSPRNRRPPERGDRVLEPPSEGTRKPTAVGSPDWGEPSPYLEERLTIARSAVSELVAQSRGVGRSLEGLRTALATIDQELERASSEIGFLRSDAWEDDAVSWRVPSNDSPLGHPVAERAQPPRRSPVPSPRVSGSYEEFTLERYNRTVGDLHARRRALGWGTVVAAAAISAVLLFLTLQAREPVPPLWLALLPLVWMIPVPFFVAAFRGTHRVLQRNRLELSEET